MVYAKPVRSNGRNRLVLALTPEVYACRLQHSRCGLLRSRRIYFRDRYRGTNYTRRHPWLQLGLGNLLSYLRDACFVRSHSMIDQVCKSCIMHHCSGDF